MFVKETPSLLPGVAGQNLVLCTDVGNVISPGDDYSKIL